MVAKAVKTMERTTTQTMILTILSRLRNTAAPHHGGVLPGDRNVFGALAAQESDPDFLAGFELSLIEQFLTALLAAASQPPEDGQSCSEPGYARLATAGAAEKFTNSKGDELVHLSR